MIIISRKKEKYLSEDLKIFWDEDFKLKSMRHEHYFSQTEDGTIMKDVFKFEAPLGVLGWIAGKLFLKRYMTNFLKGRNRTLKEYAESGKWKDFK